MDHCGLFQMTTSDGTDIEGSSGQNSRGGRRKAGSGEELTEHSALSYK